MGGNDFVDILRTDMLVPYIVRVYQDCRANLTTLHATRFVHPDVSLESEFLHFPLESLQDVQ